MRIVHDIHNRAQIGGGARPHEDESPARGFRMELIIAAPAMVEGMAGEAIHIHGDARLIRDALVQAIDTIDASGRALVKQGRLREDWNSPFDPNDDAEREMLRSKG